MPNNNLILRTLTSPYGDTTLGSVLSHGDVDNNFIFLRGRDLNNARLDGNKLSLIRLDGSDIDVDLSMISGSGAITGGTYNPNNGILTITNSTGGTFQVSGFFTSSDDVYVSGLTFNVGTYDLTIERNDGTSFTQNLGILSSDMTITGGTYNPSTGVGTFTNNSGGTFQVSGFLTGYTDTNIYNSDGTLTNNRTININGYELLFTEDIYISGAKVGLGGGQNFSNAVLGAASLDNNTTGLNNIAIGSSALGLNTTGSNNIGIGTASNFANTTSNSNIAIGAFTLENNTANTNIAIGENALNLNTTGYENIAIGYNSLRYNTTGYTNVAVGAFSQTSNISGRENSALGHQTLLLNLTGRANTAVGFQSLYANQGNFNTAIGAQALQANITGTNNVAIGLQSSVYNLTGSNLISIGSQSLFYNTGGTSNIAIGYRAFWQSLNNQNNIAIGDESLTNTKGDNNTSIGHQAGYTNFSGTGNVFLGYRAGYTDTGSNKLHIANNSGTTLIYGEFNNGLVGINTTSPTNTLHVSSASNPVRLEGVQSGATDINILTLSPTGVVRYKSILDLPDNSVTSIRNVSTSQNVLITDSTIVCLSGLTLTLPSAVGIAGKIYNIKSRTNSSIIISTTSGQIIDDDSSVTLNTKNSVLTLQSDGNNWVKL